MIRGVKPRKYGEDNSPLNTWLRSLGDGPLHPRLYRIAVMDIDVYLSRKIGNTCHWMLVECKLLGRTLGYRQVEMLTLIDRFLSSASVENSLYRGCHLVQMSGMDLPSSSMIWLDGEPVSETDLISFFRMEAPADWYDRRPWSVPEQKIPALDPDVVLRRDIADELRKAARTCSHASSIYDCLDDLISGLQAVQAKLTLIQQNQYAGGRR